MFKMLENIEYQQNIIYGCVPTVVNDDGAIAQPRPVQFQNWSRVHIYLTFAAQRGLHLAPLSSLQLHVSLNVGCRRRHRCLSLLFLSISHFLACVHVIRLYCRKIIPQRFQCTRVVCHMFITETIAQTILQF